MSENSLYRIEDIILNIIKSLKSVLSIFFFFKESGHNQLYDSVVCWMLSLFESF